MSQSHTLAISSRCVLGLCSNTPKVICYEIMNDLRELTSSSICDEIKSE